VPDADLPALYSGALALVYPSLYEGFGLPVLEGMQCGTVVITSNDPAIREVTGEAAVHVDAKDVRALAEAMVAVARCPERSASLRDQSLKQVATFSWRKTAQLTREIYATAARVFSRA